MPRFVVNKPADGQWTVTDSLKGRVVLTILAEITVSETVAYLVSERLNWSHCQFDASCDRGYHGDGMCRNRSSRTAWTAPAIPSARESE